MTLLTAYLIMYVHTYRMSGVVKTPLHPGVIRGGPGLFPVIHAPHAGRRRLKNLMCVIERSCLVGMFSTVRLTIAAPGARTHSPQ